MSKTPMPGMPGVPSGPSSLSNAELAAELERCAARQPWAAGRQAPGLPGQLSRPPT